MELEKQRVREWEYTWVGSAEGDCVSCDERIYLNLTSSVDSPYTNLRTFRTIRELDARGVLPTHVVVS